MADMHVVLSLSVLRRVSIEQRRVQSAFFGRTARLRSNRGGKVGF
ncbi:unnamed protein product [Brassica rapa]|uniref:Uncharacterized protein n=2 Tax=Brassica TaxID=3705 RepID=A0A8D9GNK1_BRACM|nr:unnamed protein product [Brassica napus]CAF2178372.1 unnamed protein product [Brassica napus]CAG7879227.1 unnamed protein product [Brassica rapa]CAG7883918.1 unnamed protein product [Brassica rapa]